MHAGPIATVVIPTHKRIPMLREAIDSALAQTIENIEVIIVVDGDDPDTAAYARSLPDPRLRVLSDGVERGEARTTVRGIEAGSAPYFSVLHDDDAWEPNLLEKLITPLEEDPELAVAFADHFMVDARGVVNSRLTDSTSIKYGRASLTPGRHQPFVREALINQTIPGVLASVYRRSLIDFSDMPELPAEFDYWLAWGAVRGSRPVFYVNERLYRYRVHDGSRYAGTRQPWREAEVAIYSRLLQEPELTGLRPELADRLATAQLRLAAVKRAAGNPGALRLAVDGLRTHASLKNVARCALLLTPRRSGER